MIYVKNSSILHLWEEEKKRQLALWHWYRSRSILISQLLGPFFFFFWYFVWLGQLGIRGYKGNNVIYIKSSERRICIFCTSNIFYFTYNKMISLRPRLLKYWYQINYSIIVKWVVDASGSCCTQILIWSYLNIRSLKCLYQIIRTNY